MSFWFWRSRIFQTLAVVCLLAYLPPLMGVCLGGWPFDGDAIAAFGPWQEFAHQHLRDGILPLWNPHLFCGQPFMANGQSGVLYPPNLLYCLLPVRFGQWCDAYLHTLLLACGGYCLASLLGLSRLSSWIVAVCLGLGGAVSAHIYAGHLTWTAARAYLPWELWALLFYLRSGRFRYLLALAVFVVLQLASGSPPVMIMSIELVFACFAARFLTRWWQRRSDESLVCLPYGWWITLPAAGILTILLTAAIVFPLAEFSRLSVHGTGMKYADAVALSGTWRTLVRLVVPSFFGGNGDSQWSAPFSPHEEAVYIGVFSLMLALGSPWLARRRDEHHGLPAVVIWLLLLLPGSLILALGDSTPLYQLLFEHLPILRITRVPVRWLEIWYFATALLAGFSFEETFVRGRAENLLDNRSRWLMIILYALAGVLIVVALFTFLHAATSSLWQAAVNLFHATDSLGERAAAAVQFRQQAILASLTATVITLLTASLVAQWRSALEPASKRRIELKIIAVVTLDLLFLFWSSAKMIRRADLSQKISWPSQLARLYDPGDRWDTQVDDFRQTDYAMRFGIDLYNGYEPMNCDKYFRFVAALERSPYWSGMYQPLHRRPLLLVTGTSHTLVSPRLNGLPTAAPVGDLPAVSIARSGGWSLWRYTSDWPRLYLTRHLVFTTESRQLQELERLAVMVVQDKKLPELPAVIADGSATVGTLPRRSDESVSDLGGDINQRLLQAQVRARSLIVYADSWFPGWQAWVNGQRQEIIPANFLFRGIVVPAGSSRVALVYNPESFRFGLFLTLVGLSLLTCQIVAQRGQHAV